MKVNKVNVYDGKKVTYKQKKENNTTVKLIANIEVDGKMVEIAPNLVKQMDCYEFEDDEEFALNTFKNSTQKAKDLYESALKKQKKYEKLLLNKINKDAVFSNDPCELSPFNKCCYIGKKGKEKCIFCEKEKGFILFF